MEEGSEGGQAGQAGPPDARLTTSDTPDDAIDDTVDGDTSRGAIDGASPPSYDTARRVAPYAIVTFAAVWLSRSFWFPGRYVVGFDTYAYSGPNVGVTEAAWRHFRLPILNDLIFGGVPHLGNPSAGGMYLPQVVTLVFGTNRGMGVLVALHLVVLGLGMVWLVRRLGIGHTGATAAGLLLVGSGAMLTKTVQYEQILVIAWAPLLLVAIHAVLHNDRPWRAVGGMSAVTATILLAGHPQLVYETVLLAVAATIGFVIGDDRWRRLPHLAFGAVLGAMIALPQLLAVVIATSDSALSLGRNQDLLDPALAMLPSSTARALLGTVQNIDPAFFVGSFESIAFVGVVGAVVAVVGATDSVIRSDRRPWAISFGVIGALALVWAVGPRTVVFDAAFDALPGFDLARASARWLVVVVIVASLFAGVGVDVLVRRVRPVHLVVVAIASVAVGLALAADVVIADRRTIEIWALTLGIIVGLLVFVVLAKPRHRWTVAAVAIILVIGVVELTAMSLHSIPMGLATDTPFTDHSSPTTDYLVGHPGGSTIALTDDGRGVAYEVPGFRPNANVLAGVPSIDGYDGGVQITKRWATALQRFTPDPPTELPLRNSLQLPVTPESMARLGVRYILLDNARDPAVFIPGWEGPLADDGDISVWENPAWIGDAVAWPTVEVTGSDEAADLLRTNPDRYEGVALVDDLEGALACTDPAADGCAPVGLELDTVSPEHLVVRADLAADSVVSVARQALPGWHVEVDGEAANDVVVDGLFLGVEVPAGEHVITWRYSSPWLVPTLIVSFLATVWTLLLGLLGIGGMTFPRLRIRHEA